MLDVSGTYFRNRKPEVNVLSPFAAERCLSRSPNNGSFSDPYFGYVWEFDLEEGDAAYGLTSAFPVGPMDSLSAGNYGRVPFRRIPRIGVSSLSELNDISSAAMLHKNNTRLMWRGQTGEHKLKRDVSDKLKLYADINVVEPSLLPSGSRMAQRFEEYMDVWFGLMDVYIADRLQALSLIYSEKTLIEMHDQVETWRNSYLYKVWAFGVAQHYGLPSTGLDLTTRIDVATFFALHRFNRKPNGETDITRVNSESSPVIYALGIEDDDSLPDEKLCPVWLQTKRAKAQDAHFFAAAWGDSCNRAAERILCIFELHNHESWKLPEMRPELFPALSNDPFCEFLFSVENRFPKSSVKVPLDRIYRYA